MHVWLPCIRSPKMKSSPSPAPISPASPHTPPTHWREGRKKRPWILHSAIPVVLLFVCLPKQHRWLNILYTCGHRLFDSRPNPTFSSLLSSGSRPCHQRELSPTARAVESDCDCPPLDVSGLNVCTLHSAGKIIKSHDMGKYQRGWR